ncbi:helix-turn-helix domain-containing protein [Halorubrum sp. Boch-26]|uniref:helix-turn-helix domain-containing protein n=1 Tax=Halorubrum sp. Boch-26 TaxID=2994426 RepID=UPI002468F197|nr:helix-turn-helix domain-containing protein [Halorubrum sp. Boch-26]
MVDTIQVQLAAAACDRCPVAALSERTTLREVRVDPDDERVEFVASDPPPDPPSELDVVEFAGESHGRYDLNGGARGGCACARFPPAFASFPVLPRKTRIDDGELIATFVLTGYGELQAIVDALGTVEVRQILVDRDAGDGEDDGRPTVIPIDLSGVTERQATVAAVAVEKGYFEPDAATADEIAADLGLAKSTVSEHLRLVTATVLSQLFGDD